MAALHELGLECHCVTEGEVWRTSGVSVGRLRRVQLVSWVPPPESTRVLVWIVVKFGTSSREPVMKRDEREEREEREREREREIE